MAATLLFKRLDGSQFCWVIEDGEIVNRPDDFDIETVEPDITLTETSKYTYDGDLNGVPVRMGPHPSRQAGMARIGDEEFASTTPWKYVASAVEKGGRDGCP